MTAIVPSWYRIVQGDDVRVGWTPSHVTYNYTVRLLFASRQLRRCVGHLIARFSPVHLSRIWIDQTLLLVSTKWCNVFLLSGSPVRGVVRATSFVPHFFCNESLLNIWRKWSIPSGQAHGNENLNSQSWGFACWHSPFEMVFSMGNAVETLTDLIVKQFHLIRRS
jgi:hypothetical protein